jgi:hypothetical protein
MTLPLARYRFTAIAQAPLQLPPYGGSLLRGQFGAALRHVACMTRQPTCGGCPLLPTCPYTRIFEAPAPPKGSHALQDFSQIPNPYVIEPPAPHWGQPPQDRHLGPGDTLQFNMVLVGQALEQLALVVFSLQRALERGLGHHRVPLSLQQVDWLDAGGQPHTIWHQTAATLVDHHATVPWFASPSGGEAPAREGVTLHIHTPLRLQSQGKPLRPAQLTPRTLISALARRTALLMDFHAPGTPAPDGHASWGDAARAVSHLASGLQDQRELRWFDWVRYSSRQQQEMTLGGVLGRWTMRGEPQTLAALHPWLVLGQWLHAGKNATMGLGGYTMGDDSAG